MALPLVESLKDCCSLEKTVTPYFPQLYELSTQLLESWYSLTLLKNIYLTTNPFISGLALSIFVAVSFYIISEVNGNVSQIDRFWSILPSVYNIHFLTYAKLSGLNTKRLETLVFVSAVWSIRLTFNFYRKGGYKRGFEDYRWEILRKKISPPLFTVFNITYISLAQSLLLFMITAPTYLMLVISPYTESLTAADFIFASVLIAIIVLEFIADQQQWNYQEAKRIYNETARVPGKFKQDDLERGFVVTGLWSISRHPNFVAEQAIWIFFYLWGSWTTQSFFNWSSIGLISYLLLFQGSTNLTEEITTTKYDGYKEYQKSVGRFLPNFSTKYLGHFLHKKAL
ncbi:Uncharacterized protein OnM2_004008 [Erysiphe neolycopersici]|uniref:DUF1295-domain-containing protein n=1 Tax=Erysiphe neolycopersici TaxID=212602 RepID=A0A420I7I8_9PEZI|nr:Uncharacterized protein OnM2_004008 [Erysiphe neolycopersici]